MIIFNLNLDYPESKEKIFITHINFQFYLPYYSNHNFREIGVTYEKVATVMDEYT